MLSSRGPHRMPRADDQNSLSRWSREVMDSVDSASRTVSTGLLGGGIPTETLPNIDIIFGKITDPQHSAGSGSGVDYDTNGPGFFDDEGYLAYAFIQIYSEFPWKGIEVLGGWTTVMKSGPGTNGSNHAYPLSEVLFNTGDLVALKRTGPHWVILGLAGEPTGSGGGVFTGECPDGTQFFISIDGTHVTVYQ